MAFLLINHKIFLQIEEIEALVAIYGDEFQTEDEENKMYSIKITGNQDEENSYVILYVKIPDTYPSTSPPIFEISSPHMKQQKKMYLCRVLEDVYL